MHAKLVKTTSIYFNGEINEKSVNELICAIERIRTETNFTNLNLYFSTEGGNEPDGAILIDYLNNINDVELVMIPGEDLSSVGFLIFILTTCKKRFIYNSMALIHISDSDLSFRKSKQVKSWDKLVQEDLNKTNDAFLSFIKKLNFLSEEDLNWISLGYDITIDSMQLIQATKNYDNLADKHLYPAILFI